MAALHPAPTRRAPPDLHPEPRRCRRRERREIGLELVGVTFVHHTAATMRATRRQQRVEGAVRIRWWESMGVTAMQPAPLTARRALLHCSIRPPRWGAPSRFRAASPHSNHKLLVVRGREAATAHNSPRPSPMQQRPRCDRAALGGMGHEPGARIAGLRTRRGTRRPDGGGSPVAGALPLARREL